MEAWTSPNPRLLTCSCASSGRSWPGRQAVSTTSKPCGAGATFCASSNHSRWQAESDQPSEQYKPGCRAGGTNTKRLLRKLLKIRRPLKGDDKTRQLVVPEPFRATVGED